LVSSSTPAGAWYLPAESYWVSLEANAADGPYRQGDLFGPIEVAGEQWAAALLVHPTCEVAKRSVRDLQVVRVWPLTAISDRRQQAQVVAGFVERDQVVRVAFAHTFFLAPLPRDDQPLFANLREVATYPKESLLAAGRRGTMTHDARVTLIRRKLYFRYRLNLAFEAVRELEGRRIGADPSFVGPRSSWAIVAA
jgi:hypothetical protein